MKKDDEPQKYPLFIDDSDGTCFPSTKPTPPELQQEIDAIAEKYLSKPIRKKRKKTAKSR